MPTLAVDPHPCLRFGAFTTALPAPLGEIAVPDWLVALLALDAEKAPLQREEEVRKDVRDLLRHGGFKPTGRGKPASEYLVRAAGDGVLGSINLVVDACNAVSLHSGLPISVVDTDRARPPFRIGLAPPGARYVFNAAGQEIDLAGLLCLCDADGPCGNAVKDSQRTKTQAETKATLSVVWGCVGHEERLDRAVAWYRDLLERAGATTAAVE
ncbi:MAG: phenylalanine--tRNA ligase beta subunit-related protein [Planctomycetota bacterium]|jgi:DNA/RNA-binding domain of Phe-tRNA-synthetase-like protein